MRSLLLTGLIIFVSTNLLHGQVIFTMNGLEVDNHEEVEVLIEDLTKSALDIGLTKNRIESRVNVRLRQVGLRPTTEKTEYLYIRIHVVGSSFSINLAFNRVVSFYVGEVEYESYARIYNKAFNGTHGRDSEFIISALDQLLDIFLNDYLDAND